MNKNFLIAFIFMSIAAASGFIGGYLYSMPKIDEIILRLQKSGYLIQRYDSLLLARGTIQEITDNKFNLKIEPPSLAGAISGKDEFHYVTINAQTKIIKIVPESEQQPPASMPVPANSPAPIRPPAPTREVLIAFSELKVGDKINVVSTNDIKTGEPITASKIILN